MEVDREEGPKELVRKPYVLNGGFGPYIPLGHCPALWETGKGPKMFSFCRWRNQVSEGRNELVQSSQS